MDELKKELDNLMYVAFGFGMVLMMWGMGLGAEAGVLGGVLGGVIANKIRGKIKENGGTNE